MSRRITCLRSRLATPSNAGGWKPDTARGTRQERGYGAAWEQLRKRILQRDTGLCQEHLKRGQVKQGNEVDHITPKAQGGTDAEANLQTLCTECHRAKTSRESTRGAG